MARYSKNSAAGTVGSSAVVTAFEANGDRARLWLYAMSGNSGSLYVRFGADPANDGSDCNIELTAGSGILYDANCPADDVRVIGSASGQKYRFEEA